MSDRLNLIVADGVGERMTALAGGERKRGEWLSQLVNAMYENQQQAAQASDIEQLRFAFAGMVGQVKIMEGRLLQVEQTVAALIADNAT